ncbi:hypothetical protein [Diaphorobacter nitroreducens]
MALNSCDLDTFLDMIADMPDIEAVDELDGRIDDLRARLRALGDAKGCHDERLHLGDQEGRCRVLRAKLVFRVEQRKWSKAVRAVFGDEGFERCLEWMRTLPDDDVKAVALTNAKARKIARSSSHG